ncbi:GNAT family N-acetyltransferase [Actinocrinis puniceicyclus]|uniref:GNAT family N-acetyltransferase n=1 Tax=Actinocrinis puniceicyclus TaxID=977794 RepID=A0A8J8BA73_9ACTN|nr:GNAT family protein [Actinocrinis puniceicyclus]MBS2962647.1 GNAT family N-acetyltransferase [Actinocrinis puniceicyclus]
MGVPGYPIVLREGPVSLRPPSGRDGRAWQELQTRNRAWLAQWEATVPPETPYVRRLTYRELVRRGRREAAAGRMMPFNVWYADPQTDEKPRMVGQLNIAGIAWGSLCSAHIGYWVDERVAGRGIIPTALALAVDHCFQTVGLHRVEVNVRPENGPSRRVAEKLGFREEGLRLAYLHIDGGWRDHIAYALTAPEVPEGMIVRWRRVQASHSV